jgi:cyclic lactone autoinducer peptide
MIYSIVTKYFKGGLFMKTKSVHENLQKKVLSRLANLALSVTTMNVNSSCWFYLHQDELPIEAGKLRKF